MESHQGNAADTMEESFGSDIFEVIGKTGKNSFILAFSGGKIRGIYEIQDPMSVAGHCLNLCNFL